MLRNNAIWITYKLLSIESFLSIKPSKRTYLPHSAQFLNVDEKVWKTLHISTRKITKKVFSFLKKISNLPLLHSDYPHMFPHFHTLLLSSFTSKLLRFLSSSTQQHTLKLFLPLSIRWNRNPPYVVTPSFFHFHQRSTTTKKSLHREKNTQKFK